jgi:hypothetical protein
MISRGSVAFAKLGGKLREWHMWLGQEGASIPQVQAWRNGDRPPNSAMRQKIADVARERFGVELGEELWDERVPASELQAADAPRPPREPRNGPAPAPTADDTAQISAQLLANIRDLQARLTDPNEPPLSVEKEAALMGQLTASAERLGRFTGVKLTERQILASPLWGLLLERIMIALEPWPDAMRAVSKALEASEKDPKA